MVDDVYHSSPYFTFTWTMSFRHAISWNLRHTPTSHSIVSYCQLYLPLCSPEMVGFLMKYIKSPLCFTKSQQKKKTKLMKSSWSPHSHHFSWRKSWRSPTVTADQWARHGATFWESAPWRSRGRWKSRNARPAEDPRPAGHRGRPWLCSICCWKETMTGWWLYLYSSEKWWSE